MANTKTGLNYYTIDCDRYQDRRIKRLKKDFSCRGIAVYDYILCEIYRVQGCFIEWDENTVFDVAEYFGLKENVVQEIVAYCASVGLFDKELLSRGIITSASIQQRYIDICTRAKRRNIIIPDKCKLHTGCSEQQVVQAYKDENEIDYSKTQPHYEPYALTIDQEIEELKNDECWIDQLQVLHSMKAELIRNSLNEFRLQCVADGKEGGHQSLADAKQHFNSWLRIVNKNKKKEDDNDKSKARNQRRGNVLSPDEPKTYGDTF